MSTINTNGINANYPTPGENNSTQGFRDNFSSIKTNLNTAAAEITDLQTKAVLKAALDGSTLNNDMANTLISNAAVKSFRSTTYNLGNSLVGTVLVDTSRADVQYGNVAGNISLQFGSWIPTNTQGNIILKLGITNEEAFITFPSEVVASNNNFGGTTLENSNVIGNTIRITAPYDVRQLDFKLSTIDCGNTISIEPLNRPYQSSQIIKRSPSPVGNQGDVAGTVAVDSEYLYVCTGDYDATTITALTVLSTASGSNTITLSSGAAAAGVVVDMPVVFDTMEVNGVQVINFGNIETGKVYYVKTISGSDITISETRTSGTAGSTFALATVSASGDTGTDATFYDGTDIWKRVPLEAW